MVEEDESSKCVCVWGGCVSPPLSGLPQVLISLIGHSVDVVHLAVAARPLL